MTDLDIYGQAAADAKNYGVRRNFGKVVLTSRFVRWVGDDGARTLEEISHEEHQLLPENKRTLEVTMSMDLTEFKPDLFVVERRVNIPSNDWKKIVEPSLRKVFGKSATLGEVDGVYVEVIDEPTGRFTKSDVELNMFKFVGKFPGRDECFTAYQAVYGEGNDKPAVATETPAPVVASTEFPPAYSSAEAWKPIVDLIKDDNPAPPQYAEIAEKYMIPVEWVSKALKS